MESYSAGIDCIPEKKVADECNETPFNESWRIFAGKRWSLVFMFQSNPSILLIRNRGFEKNPLFFKSCTIPNESQNYSLMVDIFKGYFECLMRTLGNFFSDVS